MGFRAAVADDPGGVYAVGVPKDNLVLEKIFKALHDVASGGQLAVCR